MVMNSLFVVSFSIGGILLWTFFAFVALEEKHTIQLKPQYVVHILAIISGIVSSIFVILGVHNGEDFYANLATEFGSVSITIFVIDKLYQWRAEEQEKRQIIEQMGSPSNDFAIEAVRLITKNGWLQDGSLRKANFDLADLRKAYLVRANFPGASFVNTHLENANLGDSHLEAADFTNARLTGAEFTYARLRAARLLGANSPNSIWVYADLEAADLSLVTFRQANLRYANFQKANLVGTNFEGAHLGGANFLNTDLLRAFFDAAKYTKYTLWPVGFDPSEHGAILVEEEWLALPSLIKTLPYLEHLRDPS